jgi:hydroxymethylbilane synthase
MRDIGRAFEGKNLFTQEIESALLNDQIDIAIHSMKDLSSIDLQPGVTIAAVPKRANAHDLLVSRNRMKFSQLPPQARVGTSSPRRKAQLLAARGDLDVLEMHGNVDTRLRKLAEGYCDAIIVAAAGLERLHLTRSAAEILPTNVMLPAVGQGALAIQSRIDDEEMKKLVAKIDHYPTRREIEAERAFAKRLGATCRTPIAAYAKSDSMRLTIEGMVASLNGRMLVRSHITSDYSDSTKIGEELAESLLTKGAAAVLETI